MSPALLLASASPRRRELLELAGVEFEAVATDAEELTEGDPESVVVENALRKARAGRAARPDAGLVLGADTEVVLGGRTLGKASTAEEARERLRALSGRAHQVLGAVALLESGGERTALERTTVRFRDLDDGLVDLYLRSGEWRDRAGAYAVQGLGSALISEVKGELANVIGLPVGALRRMEPGLFAPADGG